MSKLLSRHLAATLAVATVCAACLCAAPPAGGKKTAKRITTKYNYSVRFDRAKPEDLGLTVDQVAEAISDQIAAGVRSAEKIHKVLLTAKDGKKIPLGEVATVVVKATTTTEERIEPPGPTKKPTPPKPPVAPTAPPRPTSPPRPKPSATQAPTSTGREGKVKSKVLTRGFESFFNTIFAAQAKASKRPAQKLSSRQIEQMTGALNSFWVTGAQEATLGQGQFDDKANGARLSGIVAGFNALGVDAPITPGYLLAECKAGRLKGVELEVAVRMLGESLVTAQKRAKALAGKPGGSKLSFRVALSGAGVLADLTGADIERYAKALADKGPGPGRERNDAYVWHELKPKVATTGLICREYDGRKYALLCNRPTLMMIPHIMGPNAWGLTDMYVGKRSSGAVVIVVRFDKPGQKRFGMLTAGNIDRRIAFLIDGKIISAPTIKSAISREAILAGHFTEDEARAVVWGLQKGMSQTVATKRPAKPDGKFDEGDDPKVPSRTIDKSKNPFTPRKPGSK